MLTDNTNLLLAMVVSQGAILWCDTSTGALRPLVPASQRRAVFQQVHELSHAGRRATRQLVAPRFVWPGLATDVVAWCKECAACNRAKVTRQPTTTVEKMDIPTAVSATCTWTSWGRSHRSHLLTMIDRSMRWPEAVLLRAPPRQSWTPLWPRGWPALACRPTSPLTGGGVQFASATWTD